MVVLPHLNFVFDYLTIDRKNLRPGATARVALSTKVSLLPTYLKKNCKKYVVFELLGCGVLRLYLFDILVQNWLDFTLDKEHFSVDERATHSHRQPYENRGENHPHICLFAEY